HSDGAATRATAFAQIEATIGTPGESGSLNDLIVRFETSLTSAASRPDLLVRQQNILFAARDLVAHVNGMSSDAQTMRMQADHEIADKVGFLNDGLAGIAQLNRDIGIQIGSGRDANGLLDQRQVLVDQIAGIVPLRTYSRDNGQIALVSTGGAVLLDGSAAVFEFTSAGKITADMTQASGALSGLSMNGQPVRIGDNGLLEGGSLAALFEVRDTIAPMASAQADAFARDLVERFQASGVDPTVAIGAAGLFTDDGAAFDSLNEIGLAGRLMLSAAVDPAAGGDLKRLWPCRPGSGPRCGF
ncbi:MAG TPA: flagellar hook-associated protein FlgK, partial [Rhodobacteraceae bacterium]|nr:flagellar hook-associated protein FlgK [Paracoccaceae bacterium]